MADTDKAKGNNDDDNIVFTMKDTKLFAVVTILSTGGKIKLSNLFSKGFGISVYWNEYKTESDGKNKRNKFCWS